MAKVKKAPKLKKPTKPKKPPKDRVAHLRQLERHPLSAEHGDCSPEEMAWLRWSLRTNGNLGKVIWLSDGKVVDGWQTCQAAIAENVNVPAKPLPKKAVPERVAHGLEVGRKHKTKEEISKEEEMHRRREKVGEAKKQEHAPTNRALAEMLGVDEGTIRNDLKWLECGNSAPGDGSKSGKQGKNEKPPTKTQQRKATLAELAAQNPEPAEDETIEQEIKRVNSSFDNWCKGLIEYLDLLQDDPWLTAQNRRGSILAKLKGAVTTVQSCKCIGVHEKCGGEGCRTCFNSGRITKYQKEMEG